MELNNEQKQLVATWVREGLGLAEIQRRIESEFNLRPTFMDVRFLVDDLNLELTDPTPPPAKPEQPAAAPAEGAGVPEPGDAELDDPFGGAPAGGGVSIEVDAIQRPGALVSGSVTFSDGESMGWQLDQMGRLGLIPGKTEGYRPSEEDISAFQIELQQVLQKQGF